MGKYSTVQSTFWNDEKILELSIDEKYIFLYLLTNPDSLLIGITRVNYALATIQLGMTKEDIEAIISSLCKKGFTSYDEETKEAFVNKSYRYKWSNSDKVQVRLKKQFEEIKSKKIKNIVSIGYETKYKERICDEYPIDSVSIPYEYPIDTRTETVTETATETVTDYSKNVYSKVKESINSFRLIEEDEYNY